MVSPFEIFCREVLELPPAGKNSVLTITKDLNERLTQLFELSLTPRETRVFIERNYPELLGNTVTLTK